MTRFVHRHGSRNILELGFRHGVSTCYLAAALDDIGDGSITTIDLEAVHDEEPNVDQLLDRLGLAHLVQRFYEPTSYTWRLMKMLDDDPTPRFDLCYIDGAHDWFVDGFAFFLVDRLLRPGGWIIFDDLDWTFARSPALSGTERVLRMPAEERTTPQVRKVFELLVVTHPGYEQFRMDGDWAFARKRLDVEPTDRRSGRRKTRWRGRR
jgi:predicted O-methyltransferase YrrM